MIDVPVLIVGGGPVGLTASIYLSHFGINSLLVERHPGTAILPKARGINVRTMEMYRQIGLEDAIRAVAMPARFGGSVIWSESLAGREIKRLQPGRGTPANQALSVTANCGCAQDVFEPVLRQRAEASPLAQIRFGTQLTDWQVVDDTVQAAIKDASGHSEQVRARYLIAADGTQSGVRNQLGIARHGEPDVYDSINIHMMADLTRWVSDRPAALYLIEQPDLRGTFLTINGSDRWGFLVTSLSHYGYTPEQFTPDFCTRIVRQAVGSDDLDIKVLGVSAWKASALVAERYRAGPVFLAGDAAHEMPPTGGFGLNTGVQDIQNLAWKLAAVLRGEAGDALLDTYEPERRPVGEAVTRSSLLNALSMGRDSRQTQAVLPRKEFLNEVGLILGARYESTAVVADGSVGQSEPNGQPDPAGHSAQSGQQAAQTDAVQQYVPCAAPGCRAPHVWLSRAGQRLSTIDLVGRGFVLFTAPGGAAWANAAAVLQSPAVTSIVIGKGIGDDIQDVDGDFLGRYGIEADGAVLVRPDGHVGWRSVAGVTDTETALRQAVDAIMSREPGAGATANANANRSTSAS